MNEIKIYKDIKFTNPVMIAGWPGMGSVAAGMVSYLIKKLDAVKFAEITVDPLAVLDSVKVEGGIASFPNPPKNAFYYSKKPELIIFEGEVQMAGQAAVALLRKVLGFVSQFNVKTIYTGAAFPLPISHKEEPQMYGAANKKELVTLFPRLRITPMDGGHISGLNGLILGFAKENNIDAVCLLATIPQYAISLPNPKASLAIIEALQKMLGIKIDVLELKEHVRDMDDKMSLIEDKVKDVLTIEKEDRLPVMPVKKDKVPDYIVDKIEKLFTDARNDRAKAIVLKNELDRWDLYYMYEDRFLDLFKGRQ